MTIIGNSGSTSGPAPSLGFGIFAHTGLNMSGDGSSQASNQTGQGVGTTTGAASSTGSDNSGVGGGTHQPQVPAGQNTQNQGTQNEGGNTGPMGDDARRAAEIELKELQRRIAEIQGALAINPTNQLFVEKPTSNPQPVLPKPASPPKKHANKVPELPEMIEGHKASPLSLRECLPFLTFLLRFGVEHPKLNVFSSPYGKPGVTTIYGVVFCVRSLREITIISSSKARPIVWARCCHHSG
ncbi:hypothetical protein EV361DRAFT_943554 [Lentinula raphanica]|nr:hypothetical protein EV361DRAFT_943554 [Lentinula raphanica]